MASPPPVATVADWRARIDQELAGKSFEKVLVHEALNGVRIAPLYTEAPKGAAARSADAARFRICIREDAEASVETISEDVLGGADALWVSADRVAALEGETFAKTFVVVEPGTRPLGDLLEQLGQHGPRSFLLGFDPIATRARSGASLADLGAGLAGELATPGILAKLAERVGPGSTTALVSTLPYHDAGADAADEIAIALSTGARYLEALLANGLSPEDAARQIALRIAVGRDTFVELCKVRALRTCWDKLLVASGVAAPGRALVHAVCSSRTLTVRDPWVNMLRVTTQMFSAILGGADLVTPNTFDQALGSGTALGRRVARNTGLVLREESFLGQVGDPAAGAYFFESVTDALAREAWTRLRALEADGGVIAALESGALAKKLEASWNDRLGKLAKRSIPVLGVSDFANLGETLPGPVPAHGVEGAGLPAHRDASPFEALRARADRGAPEVALVTLGSLAESRPRAGFAAGFFSAGGLRTHETTADEEASVACLCGTDERYEAEAATRARALKAAGCKRVLVAGRPGALEAPLREAGVDGFVFVGCDAVAILSDLLQEPS